jgi:hypothetical protein
MKSNQLMLLLTLLAALPARPEVITWTNTSSGWWVVGANWSPNRAPSTNDIAAITSAGTYTVSLFQPTTIAGLVLGGDSGTQTLSTAEQVLTLEGHGSVGPHGLLRLALGALSGTGPLDVAGTFVWDGGTIDTNTAITIAPTGQMLIGPGANYPRILHGCVTNAGTILWKPSAGLYMGGRLHNLSGGLFESQWSPPIEKYGPNARIINDGVFRKSVDVGGMNCSVPMTSSGIVEVQTGALALGSGSVFHDGCQFLGAGTTRLDDGTNTLSGTLVSSNLVLNGASLAGTGVFSGTLKWSGGTVDGALTVATNGYVDMSSGSEFGKLLRGSLTNHGLMTWRPLGPLVIAGCLHNAADGTFDIQAPNRDLSRGSASAVIVNEGVFRKSAGTGGHACEVPLVNQGTVDTQVGALGLAGGSVFHDGCQFTGAGETRCDAGTNVLLGSVNSENLVLNGATLTGAGTLHGRMQWRAGTMEAEVLVATNAWLDIGSGGEFAKYLLGRLTNAGLITWKPTGTLALLTTLHNAPTGIFDVQDPNRDLLPLSVGATILNQGIFRKSGSGSRACSVSFTNHGTVEALGGTLGFDGGYANPTGTIRLAGGTFRLPQTLELAGGLLTGWGTVWADVTNTATVRPACSNGVLTILGNYAQGLGGRLEFELAGNTPGTNQSRLNITGAARLRGSLGVQWGGGYVPSPGTDFPVMAFASREGEFCCYDNLFLLGQGLRLEPVYGATDLTLSTVAAPEPTTIPLRVTVDSDALVCWPVEFAGHDLHWSTNLSQTNWTLLPGVTNRWLESPPLAPQKFFRLHQP